jgi:uncharacterized membrane protein
MEDPDPDLAAGPAVAQATARLRAEHHEATTALQRTVDRLTHLVGLPGFVAVLTVAILAWMGANIVAGMLGVHRADPPPFVWLQGAISTCALYVAALILTTQRRQDQLASHREQLTLELAIVADQKVAKIIELLEELRRDSPTLANRSDHAAHAMSTPSDPHLVLDAIKAERPGALPPDPLTSICARRPQRVQG